MRQGEGTRHRTKVENKKTVVRPYYGDDGDRYLDKFPISEFAA
jgi:hypothetical protein